MTASFLVRESAVVTAQAQSLDPAADSHVDLSQNVYAIFTAIDGVRYVKHLRNSSRIGADEREQYLLVLDVRRQGTVRKVVIAEDHLGIRRVQFISVNMVCGSGLIPGAWWREISRPDGITELR